MSGDCIICHVDEEKAPQLLKSSVTDSCRKYHTNIDRVFGHPVDIYPYKSTVIPVDMPLKDRKITCLTCHYVHPSEAEEFSTFIRRDKSGVQFCLACHTDDSREHVNTGKAHVQPEKTTAYSPYDEITVLRLECHNMGRYFKWLGLPV